MIVNKFIIVLCIIFLILLIRKLSYENYQTSSSSLSTTSVNNLTSETTSVNNLTSETTSVNNLTTNTTSVNNLTTDTTSVNNSTSLSNNLSSSSNTKQVESTDTENEDLKKKIQNLNSASDVLSSINNSNIEVNKKVQKNMMKHIENLLIKKRKLNENLDYNVKVAMIQEKINRIKEMTNYLSDQQASSKRSNRIHDAFRSVKCLANGLILNIQPVVNNDESKKNLFISRENEYIINVNKSILFFEKRNTITGEVCRTNSEDEESVKSQCKLVPTNGYYTSPDNKDVRNNFYLDGTEEKVESTWNNFINDRQFNPILEEMGIYFKIVKISNNIEYNEKLKTSGSLNYEMNSINYPFYIIQPVKYLDKCLNLKKTNTGARIITVEKTSNKPTERFNAFVYTSYDPECKAI